MQTNQTINRSVSMMTNAGLGAVITVALVLLMCALIATEEVQIDEIKYQKISNVVMDKPKPTENIIKPPERIEPPMDTPEIPPLATIIETDIEYTTLIPERGIGVELDGDGTFSGSALPMVQIAPEYPMSALRRNVEGFVDLMFDITAAGSTENIRVVYAEPEGYFEKASVRTLAKWKYKPAQQEGAAVIQKNMTTRINFTLE